MRADPAHRQAPPPPRRRTDFLPIAAHAWRLLPRFVARRPVTLACAIAAAGLADLIASLLLDRAHIGLGGTGDLVADFGASEATWLYALMAVRFVAPPLAAALLLLSMLRMVLADGKAGRISLFGRWAILAGCLLALRLLAAALARMAAMLPLTLLLVLGPISALLTLVLLAPFLAVVMLAIFRLWLAAPSIALGLKRPFAESWEITRGRVARLLGAWLIATAPLLVIVLARDSWMADAGGNAVSFILWLVASLLAGALSGLLYQLYRLPAALRPDRRPSHNRASRIEPALQRSR